MTTNEQEAKWLHTTLDVISNDMFNRDYVELVNKHQVSVLKEIIEQELIKF